jgi:hypothetical protein
MREGLMRAEFPAHPGDLRRVMERLKENQCAAFKEAKDELSLQPAWAVVWRMLERCLSLTPDLKHEAELDAVLRDFRRWLFHIRTKLAGEIDFLRRRKARNDLVSSAFDTLAARLKDALALVAELDDPEAPFPQDGAMELLLEAEQGLKNLEGTYEGVFGAAC